MHSTKKAFSFVEIIITISIIALLAVIWISAVENYNNNTNNSKVVADTETINNALTSYSQETKTLPMPGGNTNFFWADTGYMHSYEDADTFWVYGSITENTLPKKYLDVLPIDPRTNSYYSYGKTKATNEFEIASVQINKDIPTAHVTWNYANENWPLNLIRQYNGSNFVYNGSTNALPYNPDELVLIVTTADGTVYREWDTITTLNDPLEIFFSDGSVSIIDPNSEITLNELNFKWKDNLNTLVKIWLWAGKIWTRATHLNDDSQFEVYTQDSAAAVRWTIFSVSNDTWLTKVTVIEWSIDIFKNETYTSWILTRWENALWNTITVKKWENPISVKIENYDLINIDAIWIDDINFSITNPIKTDIDCIQTFKYDWTCVETDKDLFKDWYELVAYAPYDEVWDLDMYTNSWTKLTMDYLWTTFSWAYENNKWVIVNDNLVYSWSELGLWSEFAIEMSVLGSALNRNDGAQYNLFSFDNPSSFLWIICKESNLNPDDFYKVIYKNGVWVTIKQDLETIIESDTFWNIYTLSWSTLKKTFTPTNTGSNDNLYIWSNDDENSIAQWNSIIDYVKIYKR